MRIVAMLLLGVLAAAMTAGCQRAAMVNITAEADPSVDFTQYHTLAVSTETDAGARQSYLPNQIARAITDDLLADGYQPMPQSSQQAMAPSDAVSSEELAHVARNAFTKVGLTLSASDPQLLLTIDNLSGSYLYAVPLREIRFSSDATDDTTPLDSQGAILSDTRTARLPVRGLGLALYDARHPDKPVWRASAVSLHNAESLRALAPYLIDAMLKEFPAATNGPVTREISLEP